jgi:hypothetical protein
LAAHTHTTLLRLICFTGFAEIGVFLTGFGLFFSLLGVILFFDRGFLAIGNVRIAKIEALGNVANFLIFFVIFETNHFSSLPS